MAWWMAWLENGDIEKLDSGWGAEVRDKNNCEGSDKGREVILRGSEMRRKIDGEDVWMEKRGMRVSSSWGKVYSSLQNDARDSLNWGMGTNSIPEKAM